MNNEIQEIRYQVGEAWKGTYNAATTYGNANVVQDPTGLSVYRSLKPGNVGHPLTDTAWWFLIIDLSSIKEESDRIKALNDAIAADEAQRVENENGRVTAEQGRVYAETARVTAEQGRVSAEQQRVSAEQQRASQEQTRISQEQSRVTAEQGRVAAEAQRVQKEQLRENNEEQRVINETNRVAAEAERVEQYTADHQQAVADHEQYVDFLGVFDLSKHNAVGGVLATYADMSAALTALNALDSKYKYGGMSFKFVQSSDNKYVQYRLMSDSFNITPSNWQGVDEEPTAGSNNLVKSDGVAKAIPLSYKKEVNHTTSRDGTFYVLSGLNLQKGKTYKIVVDNPSSYTHTLRLYDSNSQVIATISGNVPANSLKEYLYTSDSDYIGAKLGGYFNGAGTRTFSIEECSVGVTNKHLDEVEYNVGYSKGITITTIGSEHSSNNDKININLVAGDKFSFIISEGTASIYNVNVHCYKDGVNVQTYSQLPKNQKHILTLNADIDSIGVYFQITRGGTVSYSVESGLILDNNISQEFIDNKDTSPVPGSTKYATSGGIYNAIPLSYKKEVSYSNSGEGYRNPMSDLNFQKGKTYKITVDTTNYTGGNTLYINYGGANIVALSGNVPAGKVNVYYYKPDNDYVGAKLRGYFSTSGTVNYSIELYSEELFEEKFDSLNRTFVETIALPTGEHSSNNDRIQVSLKKGTYVNFRVDEGTAAIDNNFSIFGKDTESVNKAIGTFGKNQDNIVFIDRDIVDIGIYCIVRRSGSLIVTADNASYVTDRVYIERYNSSLTFESTNDDAINKVISAKQVFGSYGQNTYGNSLSLLMATDTHTDWTRLNRAFELVENNVFDAFLFGGDLGDGSGLISQFGWNDKVLAATKPVIAVPGNHEYQYVAGSSVYVGLTDAETRELFYNSDLVTHNGEIHPTINGEVKNYFYKDFTKDGNTIRVIGLYQFEWNSPVDGEGHPVYGDLHGKDLVFYTQEQIDWFVNLLQDTPSDYAVIILSHIQIAAMKYTDSPFNPFNKNNAIQNDWNVIYGGLGNEDGNRTFFTSIIDAWVNGGTCNISGNQKTADGVDHVISVNTTFDGGGKFAANICGHRHDGGFAHLIDDNESITPYRVVICPTTCAYPIQNNGQWGRQTSSFLQDCLNCIIYDYSRNKIKVVRFGSNINTDGIECKSYCF